VHHPSIADSFSTYSRLWGIYPDQEVPFAGSRASQVENSPPLGSSEVESKKLFSTSAMGAMAALSQIPTSGDPSSTSLDSFSTSRCYLSTSWMPFSTSKLPYVSQYGTFPTYDRSLIASVRSEVEIWICEVENWLDQRDLLTEGSHCPC
jgi:hypothetical protein